MSELEYIEDSKKEEQRGNIILRQELKNYTPIFNVKFAIICNAILGFLFFIFGIPIVASTGGIVEYSVDYTTQCENQKICKIPIKIQTSIPPPVYVYYELNNFYSNYRDFVKSKIWSQLRGETHVDSNNNSRCEGAKYMNEVMDGDTTRYKTYAGFPLNANDYANPCGLVAKSFFNDSYSLMINSNTGIKVIEIKSDGIANEHDKTYVFKRFRNNSHLYQWINVEDERFMVWMQMETFPNFRKLWGRIETEISGELNLEIVNNYNAKSFNGTKKFILSNSSNLGNRSLIGCFLLIGALFCLIVIILILILDTMAKGKKNNNINYTDLKWE